MNKPRTKISHTQRQLPLVGNVGRTLKPPLRIEKRIFALSVLSLVVSAACYGSLVALTVVNAAARQSLVRDMEQLTAQNSTLEAAYLAGTRDITEEFARTQGYVTSEKRTFVTRQATLTYSSNAR